MRITIEIDDGKDVKVTKIEEREQGQPEGMEELTQEEAERFETASDIQSCAGRRERDHNSAGGRSSADGSNVPEI